MGVGAGESVQVDGAAPPGRQGQAYPKPFFWYPLEGFLCPIEEALSGAAAELQRMKEEEEIIGTSMKKVGVLLRTQAVARFPELVQKLK